MPSVRKLQAVVREWLVFDRRHTKPACHFGQDSGRLPNLTCPAVQTEKLQQTELFTRLNQVDSVSLALSTSREAASPSSLPRPVFSCEFIKLTDLPNYRGLPVLLNDCRCDSPIPFSEIRAYGVCEIRPPEISPFPIIPASIFTRRIQRMRRVFSPWSQSLASLFSGEVLALPCLAPPTSAPDHHVGENECRPADGPCCGKRAFA